MTGHGRLWMMVAIVIAVIGMGVSVYSIKHHLEVKASGQTDAACNISDKLSCDAAALSQYSEVGGIPLGVFGLGYFAAMAVLAGLGAFGGKMAKEHVHGYVAMVVIGVVVSLVLAALSWQNVGAFCPTCIAIYVLCLVQGAALGAFRKTIPAGLDGKTVFSGGMSAAIAVAVIVAGFTLLRPSITPASKSAARDPNEPKLATKTEEIVVNRSAYSGLGEDYRKGPDNAAVTIVEFADFQCPACQQMSPVLDALVAEFPGKVQLVFKNYPLDNTCNAGMQGQVHDQACKAAVMARCAGQYGKFWEYHGLLFKNLKSISEANMKAWGQQVGLTAEQVATCWESKDLMAKVKDDADLGNKLGVDSTPTIFLNGRKVLGGRGLDDLRFEVEKLIN